MTAAEPWLAAAGFDSFWPNSLAGTARQIAIPIEFVLQRDDERIPGQSGPAA